MKLVDFKKWKMDEAERCGVTTNAIEARFVRGKYPSLKVVRKNRRIMFVKVEPLT